MSARLQAAVSLGAALRHRAALATAVAAVLLAAAVGVAGAETGAVKGTVTNMAPGAAVARAVANAVVMVVGPSVPAAAGAAHPVMNQLRDTFVPHVLAIAAGTTVDFPNADPRLHNVFSASTAKKFDLGMYGEGETKSVTFDTPGVVMVRCNVHPKMEGWIVVHTNPYVAVTDVHGAYTIAGVPPGSYSVRVWHERLSDKELPVTVREGQVLPLDVRLEGQP